MITESELMFQLGAIMLLAFIAASLARRSSQSVMIGYIVIGVFIGPNISVNLFGHEYNGLIQDMSLIQLLSSVGLVMLMFFVGLEFSFSKLKKVRTPAIILAVIDTSVGLFVGFVFASCLGWPLIDSLFLAGVISMSSTSIAMKVLFDLKRISSPEVEFLIGFVVVETFIAMIILSVASGMIVQPDADPVGYGQLILGMVAFYAFFIWIAMWAVPRVVALLSKIDNDELFILFVLGIVFLTSGLASLMNVPPIIGAFFIGMILAETKVTSRIQLKLDSFKDAFVAIFFTAFGMLIDPAQFGNVIWMVLFAVPVVILYEAFVMSSVSLFLGFAPKASATIGTSVCGRGVESILYASVGSQVKGATMGAQLTPFAGAFCFAMSAITPTLVKHSAYLANVASRVIPRQIRFSGLVISRTLGTAVMPVGIRILKGTKSTGILLAAFVFLCATIIFVSYPVSMILFAAAAGIAAAAVILIRVELREIAGRINYSNIGVGRKDTRAIVDLVSGIILGAAFSVLLIVFTWGIQWELSIVITLSYCVYALLLMTLAYRKLYVEGADFPRAIYGLPSPEVASVDDLSTDVSGPA